MEMRQQQALIIHLKLSDEEFGTEDERTELYNIEEQLRKAIDDKSAGYEVDGHEFGGGFCKLYLYGPDANVLESKAVPQLMKEQIRAGSYMQKRFGEALDPNAKEVIIKLEKQDRTSE